MAETSDKLKFVEHFPRPFALLPNSPAVSFGAALVVISNTTGFGERRPEWASFPSLPECLSGLPKRRRTTALQRLRQSDLCTRFNYIELAYYDGK